MLQSFVWLPTTRVVVSLCLLFFVAGCGSPEERAQGHYQRGLQFLSQNNHLKAGIEFKNALQLRKDFVDAWRGLAEIEKRNPDKRVLIPILITIVELDATDVETRVQLARRLVDIHALDVALKHVEAAGELDPRHAGALGLKAGILFRLDDRAGAIRDATAALAIDPVNPEATVVLAADRLKRGDAEGALLILDRNSGAHDSDIGIQLFKVRALEALGDQEQAERVVRKLIELFPQEAVFRRMLVTYYVVQKRTDEAEGVLREWAAQNPDDLQAGLNVVRFLRGIKGSAAARHELATRINAGGKQAFQYQLALADLLFAEGDISESVRSLESLIRTAKPADANIARLKLAEVHLKSKKWDAAEPLVSEVLGKDSRNVGAIKLRASIRLARGQLDAAIADARQALNDQPRASDAMLLLASAYERNGSMELAEKQYADATKISNFEPAVGLSYVSFLLRRGHHARAEDILQEMVARSPNNIPILSRLAEVRLTRRNWVGAQEIAERIRRIGNNPGLSDQILGASFAGRDRLDESIAALTSAHAVNPTAVQPLATLIETMVRSGETDKAVALLQKKLQENSNDSNAHVLLGYIHLRRNAPDEALKAFQAAIDDQPKKTVAYQGIADVHLSRGNVEQAEHVIRTGLEQLSDSFALRLALAALLQAKGDHEGAISEYESILKDRPASMVAVNNLVSLLSDYRSDKQSLERAYAIAGILRKSPVPQFKDTLGWIEYKRGDYRNAISLLQEAATELPNDAVVQYHLGMAYIATGQSERAAEQLQTALRLAPKGGDLETKIRAAHQKAAM